MGLCLYIIVVTILSQNQNNLEILMIRFEACLISIKTIIIFLHISIKTLIIFLQQMMKTLRNYLKDYGLMFLFYTMKQRLIDYFGQRAVCKAPACWLK